MEVTEFRLQSELGQAHSHEHIYLGRVMRAAGWGKGSVFLPTRTRKVECKAFSVAIQGSTKNASCKISSIALYIRGAQILGARSPRGLHFVPGA